MMEIELEHRLKMNKIELEQRLKMNAMDLRLKELELEMRSQLDQKARKHQEKISQMEKNRLKIDPAKSEQCEILKESEKRRHQKSSMKEHELRKNQEFGKKIRYTFFK